MLATKIRGITKLFVVPLLNAASVVAVTVGIVVTFYAMEYGGPLYRFAEPLFRYGDVTPGFDEVGLILILFIAGLAYGVFGPVLIFFERLRRPRFFDHRRRCACLYALFVFLSASQMPEYVKAHQMPGYPVPEFEVQVIWLVTGCTILADACVLVWRRYGRVEPGAVT